MIAIRYHDSTKHHFLRFAPSAGYLDWATQPDPFRRYAGAPLHQLPRSPLAAGVAYAALYQWPALPGESDSRSTRSSEPDSRSGAPGESDSPAGPFPVNDHSIGEFLRCSMGLSAWKQFGQSRWALRVNPSSGNLHPTEAWIVRDGRVCHYAPREHALEERCVLDSRTLKVRAAHEVTVRAAHEDSFLVALTSITWREAWKYGERAFRYCQHDTGHAIGALRFAAAMLGWRMHLLPSWSDPQIAALLGLDRDADYENAEREEAECIAVVTALPGFGTPTFALRASTFALRASADRSAGKRDWGFEELDSLVAAARQGEWHGRANRLSAGHVDWPLIDEVARATRFPGFGTRGSGSDQFPTSNFQLPRSGAPVALQSQIPNPQSPQAARSARDIILQRRSALAFDPRGVLRRDVFFSMLERLQPSAPPWDALAWPPQVHLALFVHRVQDVTPGVYAYLRDPAVRDEWQSTMRAEFLWEPVASTSSDQLPLSNSQPPSRVAGTSENLFLLVPIDARRTANRLSCDQQIAEDGFFSLGMVARVEAPLRERGEWFYRRLFWECGLIGQVLYLEAEAAGARATGIGCYYDEPVHELLGLSGHAWQSLYHFSMGLPLEDSRLTTEPGYEWE